ITVRCCKLGTHSFIISNRLHHASGFGGTSDFELGLLEKKAITASELSLGNSSNRVFIGSKSSFPWRISSEATAGDLATIACARSGVRWSMWSQWCRCTLMDRVKVCTIMLFHVVGLST